MPAPNSLCRWWLCLCRSGYLCSGFTVRKDCPAHDYHKPDYDQPSEQVTNHRIDGMNMVVRQLNHEYALVNAGGIHGPQDASVWIDGEGDSHACRSEDEEAVLM